LVIDCDNDDLCGSQGNLMEWTNKYMTWDLATNRYTRHMEYDNVKLVITYHRIYDEHYAVDKVQTVDGTDITNLIRDRVIERLENIIERLSNEI
jgi:hypothetical protein